MLYILINELFKTQEDYCNISTNSLVIIRLYCKSKNINEYIVNTFKIINLKREFLSLQNRFLIIKM